DAPTVAAAGVILALTFASLMLAGLDNLLELGFGVGVGIVIAAFLMAPVLIPSLSTIEGHMFWWPRHARPGGPREGEATPAAGAALAGAGTSGEAPGQRSQT
ncbi:MAG: MMPL family transporter, partial [Solirubrobacterales bacterium]|nr:MMPL family transporter [Solirubrobacterales bacterium]